MKILILDIETSPNLAYVWGLFKQNISINQIKESTYVMCWAAKWYGERKMHSRTRMDKDLFTHIHGLLSEADAVVHYNGTSFDIPHLNTSFIEAGLNPPAPYNQIDLYRVVKNQFRFTSNKMAYVAPALELGNKQDNMRFEDWVGCMEGKKISWDKMVKYNKSDVQLTEDMYNKLLPYIKQHPNYGLYKSEKAICPGCGGDHYQSRGFTVLKSGKYPRYQCQDCGTWFRQVYLSDLWAGKRDKVQHIKVN